MIKDWRQFNEDLRIFESSDLTKWNEVKYLIFEVEDHFNLEFKELKVSDDSSSGGDKLVSFIFLLS